MQKLFVTISLCLFLQVSIVPAHGEFQSVRVLEIQAAFLVKFTSYVHWPPGTFTSPTAPIIIGIIERDPFGSTIDTIARLYMSNGRNIEVRRCTNRTKQCKGNIIFIPAAAMEEMRNILATVVPPRSLLVGNAQNFLEKGGMINFIETGSKIRFDISKTNSDRAGIEISSKLLKVAHSIR